MNKHARNKWLRISPSLTSILLLLLSLLLIFVGNALAVSYSDGFVWNRRADYSTFSNPNYDQNGVPVWSYEWFTRGDYTNSQLMTQVASWGPRWEQGPVNISGWDQNTNYNSGWNTEEVTTLIRWTNPVGDNAQIDIDGNLRLWWGGTNWRAEGFFASPMDVQFVLGYLDNSEDKINLLVNDLIEAPFVGEKACLTWGECPNVDIPIDYTVFLDQGDSVFWTAIPLGQVAANRWTTLSDSLNNKMTMNFINIDPVETPVPEPATLFLLGSGVAGLVAIRMKKRVQMR